MLYNLFLQITQDSTVNTVIESTPQPVAELSLWNLLKEGGPLMIPLGICSLIAIAVFVERWLAIRKASTVPTHFMKTIRENVMEGNISKAISFSKSFDTAIPNVISKGVSRIGRPVENIERAMENEANIEVYKMEKNLSILSTISSIAPIFGFLGTITGMIILFFNIQQRGFELENFAGGIYTKMMSSAVGLIIGLVSYVAYNFLNSQINKSINKIEIASNELLDILHEPIQK